MTPQPHMIRSNLLLTLLAAGFVALSSACSRAVPRVG